MIPCGGGESVRKSTQNRNVMINCRTVAELPIVVSSPCHDRPIHLYSQCMILPSGYRNSTTYSNGLDRHKAISSRIVTKLTIAIKSPVPYRPVSLERNPVKSTC